MVTNTPRKHFNHIVQKREYSGVRASSRQAVERNKTFVDGMKPPSTPQFLSCLRDCRLTLRSPLSELTSDIYFDLTVSLGQFERPQQRGHMRLFVNDQVRRKALASKHITHSATDFEEV